MTHFQQSCEDYQRVEQAIQYLEENSLGQPTLAEVAGHVGLSEYHFQRLFTRWAGISPKRFLQFLTKENAKALLSRTSVLSAACETGLSGPGRLHDLLIHTEAVTPGEYKSKGAGLEIHYGFHPTPFGECLLAVTGRGICSLAFIQEGDRASALDSLRQEWSNSHLIEDGSRTRPIIDQIFSQPLRTSLTLHLRGTNFQIKVWEALLRIPTGEVTTYQALASCLHNPGAAQAVGNAIAKNPVAYLIPCHRVLRKTGDFGEYRYGSERKKAILLWEETYRK
jgi:AraC family transcriptional regulator of adaptative response/methylated-DNA-[protein]-cysteine methyltransferase